MALEFGIRISVFDGYSNKLNSLNAGLKQATGNIDKLAMKSAKASATMATAMAGMNIGKSILRPIGDAVKEFISFDSQMSKVQAVTRSTAAGMEGLRKVARQLASDTVFDAKSVGEGMEFLARAGFNKSQVKGSIGAVLDLSSATDTALGKTADIISNIAGGFKIAATSKNMTKLSDVLALTTSRSNTNLGQLAEAFKKIQGVAAPGVLNIPLTQVAATIGILGDTGIQGGAATQTLSSALLKLGSPTKKAKLAMQKLGVSFFNAQGKFVGLPSMMNQLSKQFRGLGKEQQAAKLGALSDIFGVNAARNIATLVSATKDVNGNAFDAGEAIKKFGEELEKSDGTARQMAKTMVDNLGGDLKSLDSKVSDLKIQIGENLNKALRLGTQIVIKFVKGFTDFLKTPIGSFITHIVTALGGLITVMGSAVALKAGFTLLTVAIQGLWAAFAPLLPIIAAIGALAAVVWLGVKAWRAYEDMTKGVAGEMTTFQKILLNIGAFLHGFRDGFMNAIVPIKKIFVSVWKEIQNVFADVAKEFRGGQDTFAGVGKQMQGAANAGHQLATIIGHIATFIARVVAPVIKFVANLIGGIIIGFKRNFAVIEPVFAKIKGAIFEVAKSLGELFGMGNKASGAFGGINKAGRGMGENLGAVLAVIVRGIGEAVVLLIKGANMMVRFFIKVKEATIATNQKIMAVKNAIINFVLKLHEIGLSIRDFFISIVTSLNNVGLQVKAFFVQMSENFSAIFSMIGEFFTKLFTETIPNKLNDFVTWFKGIPDKFVKIGSDIVNSIVEGISNAWDYLVGKMKDLFNLLPSFDDVLDFVGLGSGDNSEKIQKAIQASGSGGVTDRQKAAIAQNAMLAFNANTPQVTNQNNVNIQSMPGPINLDGRRIAISTTEYQVNQSNRQ